MLRVLLFTLTLFTAVAQAAAPVVLQRPISLDTGTGQLFGSLLLPQSDKPVPVVLIIAGSGPTDRNGNRHGHPGFIGWAECKAPKKGPRPEQAREHNRMRALGAQVLVINSFELIDKYFPTTERPV